MPRALRRHAVLLLATLSGGAAPLAGQALVGLARGGGEIGAELEGLSNRAGPDAAAAARDLRGWLAVPLRGAVAGGRVLDWTLTVRPVFQQRRQPGFGSDLAARQLDVTFGARLLGRRPFNVSLDGLRAAGTSAGGYGSRREFATSQVGATLFWRNHVFPAELGLRRRELRDQWITTPGASPLFTSYVQREVRFSARSSKATVDWVQGRYDDRAGEADMGYRQVGLQHAWRWGRGSRLESTWQDHRQDGLLPAGRRQWRERLQLRHGSRLGSDHFVERSTARMREQDTRSAGWGTGLAARLGGGASAHLALARHSARAGPARLSLLTLTPRLGVGGGLPGGFHATVSAAVGLERRRTSGAAEPVFAVTDEPHAVPPARSFTLDQARVEPGSVMVRSADRAVVYAEGADYAVVVTGDITRLDVTPGGRIEPGQIVLVSYRHRVPAPGRAGATRFELDLAVERRGLALRHHTTARRASGETGAVLAGVGGYEESRTGLDLRRPTRFGELAVETGLRRSTRAGTRATEWQAGAALAPPALGPINLSHAASWSRTRAGDETVTATTLAATATAAVRANLTVRLAVESLWWDRSGASAQRFRSLSLGADWRAGAVELGGRAEWHRRRYVTRSGESRLTLRAVRRF